MGNFNEIQKGVPNLGTTYWQEINKEKQNSDNSVSDIVEMNCQTIFDPKENLLQAKNPSIFKK